MAQLWNATKDRRLLADLRVASTAWTRLKGLLGTDSLGEDEGLWIHSCNSVHTFFMKYPIDCVFLDRSLRVKSVVENVVPGRIVWPRWGAVSVIEIRGGSARRIGVERGDQLHVGS